jgi:hypothetical protein
MEMSSFKKGMAKLCAVFQVDATEETVLAYYDLLRQLDDKQWMEVVDKAGQTINFTGKLPSVANLLALSRPSAKTQAVETWAYLIKLKREAHRTQDYDPEIGTIYKLPPEIRDNPLLDKLVRHLGGWQEFCAKTLTEWDWNRFKEAFESYSSDPVFGSQALKSYTQATLEFQERKALTEGE